MSPQNITKDDIRSYYSSTLQDYKNIWLNRENLSMHFGYLEDRNTGHAASLLKANEVLADLAQIGEGDRVLDAGCGLGGGSLWLANKRRARVTGIALGTDQILLARREAKRRSLDARTQFIVADFMMLPFAAGSFDVVWAHESVCHAQDKSAFFRETARVLVTGGRLIIADFMLRQRLQNRKDKLLLEQWFDGWKLAGLWTAAQHARAAKTAGLDEACIQDFTPYTISSHRRLYYRAQRALPVETALHFAGMRASLRHGNFIAALRQYQTLRRDCWFYGSV